MTNDQFLLFPMLSYGYKNTVGAVAHLFFSDPPFAPHASNEADAGNESMIGMSRGRSENGFLMTLLSAHKEFFKDEYVPLQLRDVRVVLQGRNMA